MRKTSDNEKCKDKTNIQNTKKYPPPKGPPPQNCIPRGPEPSKLPLPPKEWIED